LRVLRIVGTYTYVPANRNRPAPSLSKMTVFRSRDVAAVGLSRTALGRFVAAGTIERVGRGLYAGVNARVTEQHTLVEAAKRVPKGIVCLLSALRFHRLTTQTPHEVWLAIDVKARKPAADWPPLRIVRFSGAARTQGVEAHTLEGVELHVTSREKTVADCFKYRNKIGLDVALEALREYLRGGQRSVDDLVRAAEVCRVARVMRPYIESLA
jgi:predicted transcriptional regulator of viral defense system